MTAFDPMLTPEQLQEGMKWFNTKWLLIYHMALHSLTKSSAELAEAVRRDEDAAEALLKLFELVGELRKWRKADDEFLEAAAIRLGLTLQAYVDEVHTDATEKPEKPATEKPEETAHGHP